MDANGNYRVALTDSQLALICMAEAEEVVSTLKLVIDGAGIITTREAGRLVRFSLTPEQLAICQKVLSDPQCRYGCTLPLLQQAAEQGNRDAIFHLANCSFMGRGMEPDMEKAFALYQKASNANHFWATFYLGFCLLNGYGTEADPQAAIACLKKLPPNALCYPAALHNIAAAYLQEKDFHTAAEVLHQVEQGSFITPFTAYSLGYLYANGLGVEKNPEEAAKRYRFAANLGHIPGKYALAKCYLEGNGVKKDTGEARKLLQQILQQLPEERLFFFGAAPFISYPNLVYAPQDMEKRRGLLKTIQSLAQKALSTL